MNVEHEILIFHVFIAMGSMVEQVEVWENKTKKATWKQTKKVSASFMKLC